MVHTRLDGNPLDNPIGIGPYLVGEFEVGAMAKIEKLMQDGGDSRTVRSRRSPS